MRVPGARHDWYEMTFDTVDDERVPGSLALALGGVLARIKGRNGYATGWQIESDGETIATVHGHSARAGEVHVTVTSDACDRVVPTLRTLYPTHRVSRADSAVDLVADFEELDAFVLEFAEARGLTHSIIRNSEGGATRYVGSPRSETRMRLYKKTEELRQKHPESNQQVQDGICRFELVARPGKRAVKERLSHMSAEDVWGLSQWSADLASQLIGLDAERVATHFRRPTDWTRALHFLGIQYEPMMQRRIDAVGLESVRSEVLAALGLDRPL
ncbi:hypothetical protein [Curtobacterium sp. MCBD17_003]|uniref:hypothetical protein n=1 Tax=Curtobacterium sp. MCBD17_003 TaxID=2175667 RepID=UPI0024E01E46|nr:hypothetical protein [Curtobacterium sp. MCBD17_003]WIE56338.1 hypothetical protein DEI88_016375 [Curtobacterium sp. MCBD17_003]